MASYDVASNMIWLHLAVARAGAITCSELLATATPSVLVPSPNVAEDHQTFNAVEMENAGWDWCHPH